MAAKKVTLPAPADSETEAKSKVAAEVKAKAKSEAEADALGLALNEQARLYPWKRFNQGELRLMTREPRQAIAMAFESPDFKAQFGRARPEDLFAWIYKQDSKMQTKEAL